MTRLKLWLGIILIANLILAGNWWQAQANLRAVQTREAERVVQVDRLLRQLDISRQTEKTWFSWFARADAYERQAKALEALLSQAVTNSQNELARLVFASEVIGLRSHSGGSPGDTGIRLYIAAVATALLNARPTAKAAGEPIDAFFALDDTPDMFTERFEVMATSENAYLVRDGRVWVIPRAVWQAIDDILERPEGVPAPGQP